MILLSALPQKWDTIATIALTTKQMKDLKFDDVAATIIGEFERRNPSAAAGHPSAHKLSAIRRKGIDPKFNQQTPQQGKQPATPNLQSRIEELPDSQQKNKRGKRGSGRGSRGGRGRGRGMYSHAHQAAFDGAS